MCIVSQSKAIIILKILLYKCNSTNVTTAFYAKVQIFKMHASLTKYRQMPNSQKYIKTMQKMTVCQQCSDLKYLILLVNMRKHAALGECDV